MVNQGLHELRYCKGGRHICNISKLLLLGDGELLNQSILNRLGKSLQSSELRFLFTVGLECQRVVLARKVTVRCLVVHDSD